MLKNSSINFNTKMTSKYLKLSPFNICQSNILTFCINNNKEKI